MTITEQRIEAEVAAEVKRIEAWAESQKQPYQHAKLSNRAEIRSLANHLVRNQLQVEMAQDSGLLEAAEAVNDMLYFQRNADNGTRIYTCCACDYERSEGHGEACEVARFEAAVAKAERPFNDTNKGD